MLSSRDLEVHLVEGIMWLAPASCGIPGTRPSLWAARNVIRPCRHCHADTQSDTALLICKWGRCCYLCRWVIWAAWRHRHSAVNCRPHLWRSCQLRQTAKEDNSNPMSCEKTGQQADLVLRCCHTNIEKYLCGEATFHGCITLIASTVHSPANVGFNQSRCHRRKCYLLAFVDIDNVVLQWSCVVRCGVPSPTASSADPLWHWLRLLLLIDINLYCFHTTAVVFYSFVLSAAGFTWWQCGGSVTATSCSN